MTTEFFVFADSREAVGGDGPIHGVRPGDSVEMMEFLRLNDWEYPVYILFREEGETRWSFACGRMRKGERYPREDQGS